MWHQLSTIVLMLVSVLRNVFDVLEVLFRQWTMEHATCLLTFFRVFLCAYIDSVASESLNRTGAVL